MLARFEQILGRTFGFLPPRNVALAVSGGVDSMALCSLASQWAHSRQVKLHGLIVDHGLRKGSKSEQDQVAATLETMGIIPHKLTINLTGVPSSRIELAARNSRITALKETCVANNITNILFGHHKDDQYETFIIRSLSHSGWYGLAGMQPVSLLDPSPEPPGSEPINSIRPLLEFEKSQLLKWCTKHNIPWVEDATNQDPSLTLRNAIRKLRVDYGNLLPPKLLPENIWAIQSQYASRRDKADAEARALWALSLADGFLQLDPIQGTAILEMTNEFEILDKDAKEALLMLLVQFATPLDTTLVSYRRKLISGFIESGYSKKVALDILMEKSGSKLVFKRAPLRLTTRADPNDCVGVYLATKEWSSWYLIDKRFWMRWKLPENSKKQSRHIGVYMNRGDYLFKVRQELAHLEQPLLHSQCITQPLFAFTEPDKSINEIAPRDLIGYPVLSCYQNLEVECQYKKVSTVN